jgi:hypothetical protein
MQKSYIENYKSKQGIAWEAEIETIYSSLIEVKESESFA